MGLLNCPNGHPVKMGQRFCTVCGLAVDNFTAPEIRCPSCKILLRANSKFCPSCGYQMTISEKSEDRGREISETVRAEFEKPQSPGPLYWDRDSKLDFAVRKNIVINDRIFNNGVIIDPGTVGIIVVDGAIQGIVDSGKYTPEAIESVSPTENRSESALKRVFMKIRDFFFAKKDNPGINLPYIYVILIDSGDTKMEFGTLDLFTCDPIKIEINSRILFSVEDPQKFMVNIMKGLEKVPIDNIKELIEPILKSKIKTIIKQYSYNNLISNAAVQSNLADDIIIASNDELQRSGLQIRKILNLSISQEGMKKVLITESETNIRKAEGKAELEHESVERNIEFDAQKLDLEDLKRRQPVLEELLQRQNLESMTRIRTEEEMERFILEIDKNKILREDELRLFQDLLKEKEEDRAASVLHLREIISLKRDQEKLLLSRQFEKENLTGAIDLDNIDSAHRREQEVAETIHQQEKENIHFESQINREKQILDFDITKKKAEFNLKKEEDDVDFARFKGMQQMKQARLDEEHERQMEKMKTEQDFELNKESISADIKKTEIDKDKAIGLANANANREHYQEKEKIQSEFLNILRQDSDKNLDRMERMFHSMTNTVSRQVGEKEEMLKKNSEKIESMAKDTMDRMADVAVSKSSSPTFPVVSGSKTTICPQCFQEVEAGCRFCDKCGFKFY